MSVPVLMFTWPHGSCHKTDDDANNQCHDATDNWVQHERDRVQPLNSVPVYSHTADQLKVTRGKKTLLLTV